MINEASLWKAAYELYKLLIEREDAEDKYQFYFEDYPVALEVLGLDVVKSFEKRSSNKLPYDAERGYCPEPDFIGANLSTGLVAVAELKTPFVGKLTTSRSDGNRAKFKANVESYISQATEYFESIRGRADARLAVQAALGVSVVSAYEAVVVIELDEENYFPEINRLCAARAGDTNSPLRFTS